MHCHQQDLASVDFPILHSFTLEVQFTSCLKRSSVLRPLYFLHDLTNHLIFVHPFCTFFHSTCSANIKSLLVVVSKLFTCFLIPRVSFHLFVSLFNEIHTLPKPLLNSCIGPFTVFFCCTNKWWHVFQDQDLPCIFLRAACTETLLVRPYLLTLGIRNI